MQTTNRNGNGQQADGLGNAQDMKKIENRWARARSRYFQAQYRKDRAEEEIAWAKTTPWNTEQLNRAKRDLALTRKGLRQAEENLKQITEIRSEAMKKALQSNPQWETASAAA